MSELKKLARLGADTRKLAALLQAKAPPGEMLAYISPKEAALLRSRGGSGKPHADTGIPSFQEEFTDIGSYGETYAPLESTPSAYDLAPGVPSADLTPQAISAPPPVTPVVAGAPSAELPQFAAAPSALDAQLGQFPMTETGMPTPTRPTSAAPVDISGRLAGALGVKEDTLTRLGLGGLQALVGGRQARRAAEQGRQGAAEQRAIAQPYQQLGQQLQSQAQRGELTPQAQRSLQAAQAQIAQGVQQRGGVGATQAAAQIEAVRQQLLQSQADYGLKISGIGDQIALGAIRAGMQADQYVNQLTSSYFNNIMRLVGNVPSQQVVQQGVQR